MLEALEPYIPKTCRVLKRRPSGHCPDPIGSMTQGLKYGFKSYPRNFNLVIEKSRLPDYCWSMLRDGSDLDIGYVFNALSECNGTRTWKLATSELFLRGSAFNGATGKTILHLAVQCKKLSLEQKLCVVEHIMSFKINPFVPDKQDKRAIDLCNKKTEKELVTLLEKYQRWRPDRQVMQWYGPYCEKRLLAFAMVEKRLKIGMPRDLRNIVLRYIAETDYLWVPRP